MRHWRREPEEALPSSPTSVSCCILSPKTSIFNASSRLGIFYTLERSSVELRTHFIYRSTPQSDEEGECGTAWLALVDRVAELVESVFNSLLATLTGLIASKPCLPALAASWDLRANTCRDNEVEAEEGEGEEIEITDDTSIDDLVSHRVLH